MKKALRGLSILLVMFSFTMVLMAQSDVKPLCKSWKIVRYEMFGVGEEPGEERKEDALTFNLDKTFVIVEKGATYKGTYTFNSGYVICKSSDKTFNRTYRIVEVKENTAIVEYKDPDLIKTKYFLELKQ